MQTKKEMRDKMGQNGFEMGVKYTSITNGKVI